MSIANYARLIDRDGGTCLHCGTDAGLVPQHRMNRGMGGSVFLDMPANIILMCSRMNGDIEADSEAAGYAIDMGWKIIRCKNVLGRILESPVFDRSTQLWYLLDNDWTRTPTMEGPMS